MGLFTLHNCCVSCLFNFLKLKLDSQCRLAVPEFSGYHCRKGEEEEEKKKDRDKKDTGIGN